MASSYSYFHRIRWELHLRASAMTGSWAMMLRPIEVVFNNLDWKKNESSVWTRCDLSSGRNELGSFHCLLYGVWHLANAPSKYPWAGTLDAIATFGIFCGTLVLHALEVFAGLVGCHCWPKHVAMTRWPAAEPRNLLVEKKVAASDGCMNPYAAANRLTRVHRQRLSWPKGPLLSQQLCVCAVP